MATPSNNPVIDSAFSSLVWGTWYTQNAATGEAQFTFWNDFSCKMETVQRAGVDGRSTLITEQAGEWDIIVDEKKEDKRDSSSSSKSDEAPSVLILRVRLFIGTTITHQGDVMPLFGEAPPRVIDHPLPSFAASFKRKDGKHTREQALVAAVTSLQDRINNHMISLPIVPAAVAATTVPSVGVEVKSVPIVAAPAKSPSSPTTPAVSIATTVPPSSVALSTPASSIASTAGPPSLSLVKTESKEIKRRNDDELPPLSPLSTAYLEKPSEAERVRRGRVLQVYLRHNGPVKTVGEAIRYLASLGTTLSEVTFYLRFYIANQQKINGDFLAASADDRLLFDGVDELTAWRYMVKSKLSEVTGCGHFASVYRDYIFFASPSAAKAAIVPPSVINKPAITPATIGALLAARPQSSFLVRIEWSMYDYDTWNADRRASRKPAASDFHAYLLAIDALPAGSPPSARRTGWLVQSLWYHYDSSITPLSADQLAAHLTFCGRMDGHTKIPVGHHYHFTSTYHYGGVHLSTARPSGAGPKPAASPSSMDASEKCVNNLDVFNVHEYNVGETLDRLRQYASECLSASSLSSQCGYALTRCTWNHILDIVWSYNAHCEASANRLRLYRADSFGNFLPDEPARPTTARFA